MGGMAYMREAPALPPIVTEGGHFEVGQPLYIIEVMKMFNKVIAPFSGTIKKVLVTDGVVVRKGQRLFEVEPDEPIVLEEEGVRVKRRRDRTKALLEGIER
jgi:biotin carboxyl carrier protein